jgi:hypothetical protein
MSAYVLNGVGADLSITIAEREDPVDINALLQLLLGLDEPLDRFHPVLSIVETCIEAADPIGYAPRWRGAHASLLLVNGHLDPLTPEATMDAITIAGRASPIADPGWDYDPWDLSGLEPLPLPIQGNTIAPDGTALTTASFLNADTDHFTLFESADAQALALSFWQSALTGAPLLDLP